MVANGLGTPQSKVSKNEIVNIEKVSPGYSSAQSCGFWQGVNQFGYISQLLYIPALALGKLSTVVYLRALSPVASYAIINQGIEAFVAIWAVASEFAIAFQCALPTPYAIITSKCFNMVDQKQGWSLYNTLTSYQGHFLEYHRRLRYSHGSCHHRSPWLPRMASTDA